MQRALELACLHGTMQGPNPRVGCVILAADGSFIAEGAHRGAGTPHAEVVALAAAGDAARGATAVVTLEPCGHTGRTGPCALALIDAGISRVVYAQDDPHAGHSGAGALRAAGLDVESGVLLSEAEVLNRRWTGSVRLDRPWVIWKVAATLDGRIAAADGTTTWITGAAARSDVHRLRSEVDAVLVGTTTAIADNPRLDVRIDGYAGKQPIGVAMGLRELPAEHHLARHGLHLRTHDPREALAQLRERDVHSVMVEGGATVAAAFLEAGLVDEIVWYVAPALLGSGTPAVTDFGVATLAARVPIRFTEAVRVGEDLRINALLVREA